MGVTEARPAHFLVWLHSHDSQQNDPRLGRGSPNCVNREIGKQQRRRLETRRAPRKPLPMQCERTAESMTKDTIGSDRIRRESPKSTTWNSSSKGHIRNHSKLKAVSRDHARKLGCIPEKTTAIHSRREVRLSRSSLSRENFQLMRSTT